MAGNNPFQIAIDPKQCQAKDQRRHDRHLIAFKDVAPPIPAQSRRCRLPGPRQPRRCVDHPWKCSFSTFSNEVSAKHPPPGIMPPPTRMNNASNVPPKPIAEQRVWGTPSKDDEITVPHKQTQPICQHPVIVPSIVSDRKRFVQVRGGQPMQNERWPESPSACPTDPQLTKKLHP